jgi:hypothetical protein
MPTDDHLHELSALELKLLQIGADKVERVVDSFREQFRLADSQVVQYPAELDGSETQDRLRMTPNAWHLDDAAWARVAALDRTRVTVGCHVLRFLRNG